MTKLDGTLKQDIATFGTQFDGERRNEKLQQVSVHLHYTPTA
jgi:hypothetical protein